MKKILYITLLLFTCISCDEVVGNYNQVEKERRQKRIEEHINDTTDLQKHLYNVKFDGHLYVVYKEKKVTEWELQWFIHRIANVIKKN